MKNALFPGCALLACATSTAVASPPLVYGRATPGLGLFTVPTAGRHPVIATGAQGGRSFYGNATGGLVAPLGVLSVASQGLQIAAVAGCVPGCPG